MRNKIISDATVSAVMRKLGKNSAKARHKGMSKNQISEHYRNLRKGSKQAPN